MDTTDRDLAQLAHALAEALTARQWRIACAESCTGGWLAKVLTDLPGCSAWFGWGYVSYANAAKTAMLGVPEALLEQHGAVSEPVARAMAEGARRASGAEIAIAITGIAGPDGSSQAKPVGTVWLAWAGPGGTRAECAAFRGNRESVRRQSIAGALVGALAILESQPR